MRDYGKKGGKCKHAYAEGGKVVRTETMPSGASIARRSKSKSRK